MAGQPPLYKPEYCQRLIDHMSRGLSYESFSAEIDTCRTTLYNWERQFPEFLDAKKIAMDKCQAWWEKKGMDMYSSKEGPNLQASIWIFNMKARFRWRDVEIMHEQLPTPPKEVTQMSIEDKRKLLIDGRAELKKLEEELEKVNG